MIAKNKHDAAISAIQRLLVGIRAMAYENEPHRNIAEVADYAEYLPLLILDVEDKTEQFRGNLQELSEKYPSYCRPAYDQFMQDIPNA